MKEKIKNMNNKVKNLLKVGVVLTLLLFITIIVYINNSFTILATLQKYNTYETNTNASNELPEEQLKRDKQANYCYLSDIEYVKDKSSVGWGSITLDKNIDTNKNNGLITLIVDGKKKSFLKGVLAHATSTLIYDISSYDYDYFTTYIGLDESQGTKGNGIKFAIYTSVDGENWDLHTPMSPPVMKGTSEAIFIKINIKEANYIKLYCHNNGNDGSDHAVYADAKLIKEDYIEDNTNIQFIKTLEEYDEIIKRHEREEITGEYELVLLQREFVKNVGYEILQSFTRCYDSNRETVEWLMTDLDTLRLYMIGGKPDGGSYIESLRILNRLYHTHKEDLENTEVTKYGTVLGELYKRMMITLSLTHTSRVALWMQPGAVENQSDPVTRYEIYKQLHKDGKFVVSARQDHTKWFEELKVEEMRYVMNNIIDDEEILWLNEYTQKRIDAHPNKEEIYLQPHTYIAYVWPNYANPVFHDLDRKDYWDEKFEGIFSKYGVTYSTESNKVYKVWMNLRNEFGTGAVCGGISKLGSNIRGVHGTPSSVISQPGHAALIYYRKLADGRAYWTIDNDIIGWAQSGKTERLGIRMPLGWGNDSYVSGWAASYIVLAQEALNDFDNYEKSEEIIMLADVYKNNSEKVEEIYREAIRVEHRNIDAWYGLIKLYKESETKTENDFYNLAEELSENLKYYPLPMYNLLNLIKQELTSTQYSFKFTLLQTRVLQEGTTLSDDKEVVQPSITRTVAKFLLGQTDTSLATFSFDGEDAGKIVLSNRYNNTGIRWDYSIDGKKTWKEVSFSADEEHKLLLSEEQLDSITSENDIYVHIIGTNYEEKNLYKIDILEQPAPSIIYNNDLENKVIGATPSMEWKMEGSDVWTSFKDEEPDLTGDKTVVVRNTKTGVYLTSSEKTLAYTTDIVNKKRKYISISHLSLHGVSSEATEHDKYAKYAIDGNMNTGWHSAWNGSDTQRYIIIKLDEPKYLTALDYNPGPGGNGGVLNANILVSVDGENWIEVVEQTNWANNSKTKTIDFDEPVEAQYIKLIGKRCASTNGKSYMISAMINLYEDTTIQKTEPENPEQPIDPENPDKPVDPEQPIDPENPDKPVDQEQPIDPENPDKPVDPEQPIDPENPDKPVDPEQPTDPENPDKPVDPEQPTDPENPEQPESITSKKYRIEEKYIYRIADKTTITDFKENVDTKQEMIFTNKDGEILGEEDTIATGTRLRAGKTLEYTLIVSGDIDKNGKITITDLAKMKLHLIKKELLTGDSLKAADFDGNGAVTITDLVQLKLKMIVKNK